MTKQSPPKTPDIQFSKTYPRRYDSRPFPPQEEFEALPAVVASLIFIAATILAGAFL